MQLVKDFLKEIESEFLNFNRNYNYKKGKWSNKKNDDFRGVSTVKDNFGPSVFCSFMRRIFKNMIKNHQKIMLLMEKSILLLSDIDEF